MPVLVTLFLVTCFLAYANGANDNFKGVATLFGSRTTNYKVALGWATLTTFFGSVCSIFFASVLIDNFTGKGLVPNTVAGSPDFLAAVGIGAGLTVILATVMGFPISTTHALTGALVGAGFMAVGTEVNYSVLGSVFFLPLLLSPLIALVLGSVFYMSVHYLRIRMRITKQWCLCASQASKVVLIAQPAVSLSPGCVTIPDIMIDTQENCVERYAGKLIGVSFQKILDCAHFLSAGMVSFARGLNDAPKIAAIVITLKALNVQSAILAVAIAMALGGLINAKKVAQTMSNKITPLNHGQGFTANVVTGILVIVASRLGMPVSTTHVAVGSLLGIGVITKKANIRVVSEILLSWVLTLPVGAILSCGVYWILQGRMGAG